MFLNPTNDLEVMIIKSCWYCWKFLFELKEVAYRLWNLSLKKARFAVTPNSKIIGNSRSFLKRWRLRISISNERSMNGWSWYDFWDMTSNWNHFFNFLLVFKVRFLMQYECMMAYNISALYVPHQKKRLTKYRWCTYSRWQNAFILVVSSIETILHNRG
jgi:hypothetical protein